MGLQLTRGGEYAIRAMTTLRRVRSDTSRRCATSDANRTSPRASWRRSSRVSAMPASSNPSAGPAAGSRSPARPRDHDARGDRGRRRADRPQHLRAASRRLWPQPRMPHAHRLDRGAGAHDGRPRRRDARRPRAGARGRLAVRAPAGRLRRPGPRHQPDRPTDAPLPVALRMRVQPAPRVVDDRAQRSTRRPAQRRRGAPVEATRTGGSPGRRAVTRRATGHPVTDSAVEYVEDRVAGAGAQVVGARPPAAPRARRRVPRRGRGRGRSRARRCRRASGSRRRRPERRRVAGGAQGQRDQVRLGLVVLAAGPSAPAALK